MALATRTRLGPYEVTARIGSGGPVMLAIVVAAVGYMAMLGWIFDMPTIARWSTAWEAMRFNSGLCFVLLGVGTAAVLREEQPFFIPTLLGVIVAGISAATLIQYATGLDFQVDQLFAPAAVVPATESMAPQTAALLVASSLTTLAYSLRQRAIYTVAGASIVASIGAVGMVGYGTGIEAAYTWTGLTRVSFNAFTCFTALGLAYLLALWKQGRTRDRLGPLDWIHVPITFIVLAVLLSLWHWTVTQLASSRSLTVAAGEAALAVALAGGVAAGFMVRMSALAFRSRVALQEANGSLQRAVEQLTGALADVKTLTGLLPICAWCKRVREDGGYWSQVEAYVARHTDAEFSHGACPECEDKVMADIDAHRTV